MELWTAELAQKTPELYSGAEVPVEEKVVVAKFFALASAYTWYVTEAKALDDGDVLFFGYVDSGDFCSEWGTFLLSQLRELRFGSIPRVERDLFFEPKQFCEIEKYQ